MFVYGVMLTQDGGESYQRVTAKLREQAKEELKTLESILGQSVFDGEGTSIRGDSYVYVHCLRDSKEVVYVGKGKNDRDQEVSRTVEEHETLLKANKIRIYRVMINVSESAALEQESYLIGMLGRAKDGGALFNIQGGVRLAKNHMRKLDLVDA